MRFLFSWNDWEVIDKVGFSFFFVVCFFFLVVFVVGSIGVGGLEREFIKYIVIIYVIRIGFFMGY